MIPNNNLNILPFYSSIDEQNHRKPYAYNDVFPLITSSRKLLPFQINREHAAGVTLDAVVLRNLKTGVGVDILTEMAAVGLIVREFAAYDLIINNAAFLFIDLVITPGQYYLEVTDANNAWYSEVFTVVNNLADFLKIEYWDSENCYYNGGHVDYQHPFRNYCYVNTEIGKPEYPFKEDAQNRDGHLFIEKQISEKKYRFEFLAPEYLCDALRIVRMSDYINIYFRGKTYNVENIIFDPKWKAQGNLAVMEVEFECDTVIKKIGKGILYNNEGDFNDDFNDDFNN